MRSGHHRQSASYVHRRECFGLEMRRSSRVLFAPFTRIQPSPSATSTSVAVGREMIPSRSRTPIPQVPLTCITCGRIRLLILFDTWCLGAGSKSIHHQGLALRLLSPLLVFLGCTPESPIAYITGLNLGSAPPLRMQELAIETEETVLVPPCHEAKAKVS